jgi:hypothetical protein
MRNAAVAGLMRRCRTFRLMLSWRALQQDLTCKASVVIALPESSGISRILWVSDDAYGSHGVLKLLADT